MSHLTLGHFFYVVAAVDVLLGLVWLVRLRDAPPPAPDGGPGAAAGRIVVVGAMFATAVALCLIGTFTDVAKITIF